MVFVVGDSSNKGEKYSLTQTSPKSPPCKGGDLKAKNRFIFSTP